MTEWIRGWLTGVSCAAMVLAVAEALIPRGAIRHICRLASGLMLLFAAVSPVLKLDETAWADAVEEYQVAAGKYEETLGEQNNLLYKSIIEENSAAYILDKASEIGISCRAEVTVAFDENGNPYPHEARLLGEWTDEQRMRLSNILETDLGIQPQQQYFERNTK